MSEREPAGPPAPGSPVPVRAGCGFVFGLFLAFAGVASFGGVGVRDVSLAWVIGTGVVCAVLSARYGDRFWEWILGRS